MANIIQSKEEIKDKLIQILKENVLEFQEIEIDLDTKKIIRFYYLHLPNV